jgi:hypothetical protein
MKSFLPLVCIALFLAACNKDTYETGSGTPIDLKDTVSFKNKVLPIFLNNCLGSGCHVSGGKSPELTAENAYNNLLSYVDSSDAPNCALMKKLTASKDFMPPTQKLSADKINTILAWIKQGYLDN